MITTVSRRPTSRSRRSPSECCRDAECGTALRNNYFEGKRLTPDALRVEQRYLVERRRLLNRAIHGWGVVFGYGIRVDPPDDGGKTPMTRHLEIGAGLALDRCGRELLEVGNDALLLADVIVLDEKGERVAKPEPLFAETQRLSQKQQQVCWLLSVHYAEQNTDPVTVIDSCRCEEHEWDHVCETVRYTLRLVPCADCCREEPCHLTCRCTTSRCHPPEETSYESGPAAEEKRHREVPPRRGAAHCLCDYLTRLRVDDDCPIRLCEIREQCGCVRVDLDHEVPLACVSVVPDDCGGWTFGPEIEACGPRRLVKRNDLLFDLIRGCDLTRIIDFGWKQWHRIDQPVAFASFSAALGPEGQGEPFYFTKDFWVRFSRPVREDTVRPDCFAITVFTVEDEEGGWWEGMRVPIIGVDTNSFAAEPGDPPHHVRGARLVVEGSWVEAGVRGRRTIFEAGETRVEIEVRGDFIIDCNGQPVDANAVGRSTVRTGNGAPGGIFLSGFRVAPASPGRPHPPKSENAERLQGVSP